MLPWIAACFAGGIAAGDRGLLAVIPSEVVLVQLLLLGAVCARSRVRAACALGAVFAAGALAMAERREAARFPSAAARLEATIEGRVAARIARGDSIAVDLAGVRRVDGNAEPLPRRVRIQMRAAVPSPLAEAIPGDVVRARVRLRPLVSRFDPGSADPAERLRRAGIGATGSLVHPALSFRFERGAGLRASAVARARRAAAAEALAERGAGLAGALALGAREGLAPGDEAALRSAGLTHLLAVSGLNLAMVAALAFGAVRRLLLRAAPRAVLDPRRAALAAAFAAALGYAALTGFEVSVQRALAFLTVACGALWLRRPVAAVHVIAAAVLAVLAAEPAALFEPGAQLSFAAAAALLLARGPRETAALATRRQRIRAWLAAALRTSSAAIAATLPIVALHFGRLAPGALLANLVAVPLTELVLLPASLVAALAALMAPEAAWLASPAVWIVRVGSRWLAALARAASSGAAAELTVGASALAVLAASLAGGAALAARATVLRLVWLALAHAALALAPGARWLPAEPRLVALDVGQGDALLVQGRSGALLVDGGTALAEGADLGRSVVVPALVALGVRRLDVVAASHADLDHRGGLGTVLRALPVGELWLPHGGRTEPGFAGLLSLARERGIAVAEHGAGDPRAVVGDLAIEPLWPPRGAEAAGLRDNDRSLVLRVEVAGARVLLTGDLEARAEAALVARGGLDAHVLKLGHHGSRTSSTAAFVRAVGAELAIASAPCLGRFRMPHPEVAGRLDAATTTLWWTGRDGAVFVGLGAPRVVVGLAPGRDPAERWSCGN